MTSGPILQMIAPLLLAAGTLARVPVAVRVPQARGVVIALALTTVTLTVNVDPVYAAIDSYTVANLANLIEHLSGVAAASAMLHAIESTLTDSTRAHRHLVPTAIVLVGMVATFATSWAPQESRDFTAVAIAAGHLWAIRAYWLVGLGWAAYSALTLARLAWRHGPQAGSRAAQFGMRLVMIGCTVAMAWALLRSYEVIWIRPGPVPAWFDLLSKALLAGAAPTVALGLLTRPLLVFLARMVQVVTRTGLVARLWPLWRAAIAACPQVRLPARVRSIDEGLHRMVVEISDALLVLRATARPTVTSGDLPLIQGQLNYWTTDPDLQASDAIDHDAAVLAEHSGPLLKILRATLEHA